MGRLTSSLPLCHELNARLNSYENCELVPAERASERDNAKWGENAKSTVLPV